MTVPSNDVRTSDVQSKLDEIVAAVEGARSMPMSASCVVNRSELVGLLQELRASLPAELAQAASVMADHEQMVAEARAEADRIIRGAHAERGSLISDTEVVRRAQAEADRVLGEAKTEVVVQRQEAEDYVDSKLANFEVVLTKTLGAVGRGRAKLSGNGAPVEEDGEEFQPKASPSPEVDEYVDVKLATLQAVLSGTLEAVGRGRDKLLGKAHTDELGAYLAAADEAQQQKDRAEAVAAGFAADGFFGAEGVMEHRAAGNGFPGAEPVGPAGEQPWAEQPWNGAEVPQQQSWPGEAQSPAAAGWQPQGEPASQDLFGNPLPAPGPYPPQQGGQYGEVYAGGYDPAAGQDSYGGQYGYQQGYPAAHDPYAVQPVYPQQGAPEYGQQPGYAPQEQYGGYAQPDYPGQQPGGQGDQGPAEPDRSNLDETSFFDTSMIDMTRLRELGGR